MYCTDVIDEDVPDLLVALQKDDVEAMRPAAQVKVRADGDMDTYGDYDDYEDHNDENDRPHIPEYKDIEGVTDSDIVYTASNCNLLKVEMDDRLAPFCALETRDLRRFVVNYLISRKVCLKWDAMFELSNSSFIIVFVIVFYCIVCQATKEAQLILGFFNLKKTFVDSAEFVLEHNGVNNQPPNPCPEDLKKIPGACQVDESLRKVLDSHNFADHKKKGEKSCITLNTL